MKFTILACIALAFCACTNNRPTQNFQKCTMGNISAPADSFGILILPEKKWYPLNENGSTTLALNNVGMYTFRRKSKQYNCSGSSKLILANEVTSVKYELNFIYNKQLADTDTLSVLGLLNFKNKELTITEVFPEPDRKPIPRGKIVIH
jgi:hypothetical protein